MSAARRKVTCKQQKDQKVLQGRKQKSLYFRKWNPFGEWVEEVTVFPMAN
jgi:hypothetical protein